jgi:hypothetical protein
MKRPKISICTLELQDLTVSRTLPEHHRVSEITRRDVKKLTEAGARVQIGTIED